ncbi:hypothetical protein M2149_001845 [Lachnospiraceae bacterium PFB1-21]
MDIGKFVNSTAVLMFDEQLVYLALEKEVAHTR